MKVGIVCYPTYGGSGVVASELGLALANRGFSVHIISYEIPFRLTAYHPNLHYHEVEVPYYPLFKYPPITLALASKIIEVYQQEALDILHVHYAIPHSIGAYLARQVLGSSRPRIITTLHGTDITLIGQQNSFYPMVKFGIEISDAVTCVSHYLKNTTQSEFNISRNIEVIYNFVDTTRYKPEYKSREDCPFKDKESCPFLRSHEKMILHISNFRPTKNIPVLIKTFARVRKSANARLVLVGDGPDLSLARHMAQELNILSHIEFPGKISSVECIIPHADVFFLPSLSESFGLAMSEAMSCAVPSVSSNVGGLPEVADDGKTGFLCDPMDENAMAEKILFLLNHPEQARKMGENARNRVIEKFNADMVIEQYLELYKRMDA